MGIIGWIILGLLAGAIAKAILPGDDPGGIIVTGLIGIVGAVIGGFLSAGAILLLLIYRLIVGRSTRGKTAY